MSKFTPGPWCAHRSFPEFIVPVEDADKKIGATENKWERHEFARIVHAVRGASPERLANAALIAAAPEMYALIEQLAHSGTDSPLCNSARAILAKVEK